MDWAASEWKESLSGLARKKVEDLEEQLTKHQKISQQKQLQNEQLEQALNNQKKKTEDEKTMNSQLTRDVQSLCEQHQELRNKNEKLQHDMQFRENQLSCLEGQLTSNKTLQANVQLSSSQIEELQMENRDLKAKCARLEQNSKMSGSQDLSFTDKIGTPARNRQGLKSEDELQRLHYQNDLLSSQVKDLEQKLRNLSKDRECDRHNQEATRVALEAKYKEKENTYQDEIRNQSQAAAQFSKLLEETKIKLQQEMSKSVALDSLRAQADRDSTSLMNAEKEKREQQQAIQEKSNKLRELENVLAEMKKTLQQHENNQENFQLKVDAAEAKATRLEKELKTADNELCAVRKELEKANSYEEKNKKLSELLSTMEHNFMEKENMCKTLKNETTTLQAANEQHVASISDLKLKNSELLQDSKSKEKEVMEANSNTDKLNKLISEKAQIISSLEDKISNSTLLSQGKDSQISELQQGLHDKIAQASTLHEQLNAIRDNLTSLKLEVAQKQKQLENSDLMVVDLQKSLSLANEAKQKIELQLKGEKDMFLKEREVNNCTIEKYKKELSEKTSLVCKAEENILSLKSAIKCLEESSGKEIAAVRANLAERSSELSLLKEAHESQKKILNAKENELVANEKSVESAEQKVTELQESFKELHEVKESLEKDVQEKDKKIINAENELKKFSETETALKLQLSDMELKFEEQATKVGEFNSVVQERAELQRNAVTLQVEACTLKQENVETKKALENLSQSFESLQKSKQEELESLKHEYVTKSKNDLEEFQAEREKLMDDVKKLKENFEDLEKRHQLVQNNLDEKICEVQDECSLKLENMEKSAVAAIQTICDEIKTPGFSANVHKALQAAFHNKEDCAFYSNFQDMTLILSSTFEKMDIIKSDNEGYMSQIEGYKAKLDSLTTQLDEANKTLLSSSEAFKSLEDNSNSRIAALDSNFAEKAAELSTLNEQFGTVKDILNAREHELSEKAQELKDCEQSVAELRETLALAREEKERIEQQLIKTTEEQLKEKELAVGQYENKLTEATALLDQANSNLLAFKATFKDFEDRSNNELTTVGTKLTEKTSELTLLQEQLTAQKENLVTLQQELCLKEQCLEKSECSVTELQRSLSEMLQGKETLERQINEKDTKLVDAESKLKDFFEMEASLQVRISALEEEVQEKKSKIDDVVQERDELLNSNSTVQNEASSLKQVNNETRENLDKLSQRYESLEKAKVEEFEILQKKMEEVSGAYENAVSRLEEEEARSSSLLEDLTAKSASHEHLEEGIEQLKLSLAELEGTLQAERQEFICEKDSLLGREKELVEILSTKNDHLLELQQRLESCDVEVTTSLRNENKKLLSQICNLELQIGNIEQNIQMELESNKANVDFLDGKISQQQTEIDSLNSKLELVDKELAEKCALLQQNEVDRETATDEHLAETRLIETKVKNLEDELEKVYESNTDLLNDIQTKEEAMSKLGSSLETAEQKLVDNLNLLNNIHNSVASLHSVLFPDDSFSTGSFDPDFFLLVLEKLKAEVIAREYSTRKHAENEKNLSFLCVLDTLVVQLEEMKTTLSERTAQIRTAAAEGDTSTSADCETNQLGLSPSQTDRSGELLTPDAELPMATRLYECMEYVVESVKRLPTSGSTLLEEMNQIQLELSSLKEEHNNLQSSFQTASSVAYEQKLKVEQISELITNILGVSNEENCEFDELLEKMTCKIQHLKTELDSKVAEVDCLQEQSATLKDKFEAAGSIENQLKMKICQISDKIINILGISGEENLEHDHLVERLTSKYRSLESECKNQASTIASLQETVDEVESYLQNTFDEKRKLEEELEKLQQKYSEMPDEVLKMEEDLRKLRNEIQQLEQCNSDQRNQIDILDSDKKALELGLEGKNELLQNLETQLQCKTKECESLTVTIQENEVTLKEQSNLLTSITDEVKNASSKCGALEEQLRGVKDELSQKVAELTGLQNEIVTKTNHTKQLEDDLLLFNHLKEENARLKAELDSLLESAKKFVDYEMNMTDYNNLKLDNENLKRTADNLRNESDLMQIRYEEIQRLYEQFENDNQKLKSEKDLLEEELQPVRSINRSVSSLIEENDDLQNMVRSLKDKLTDAESLTIKLGQTEEALNEKSALLESTNREFALSVECANELKALLESRNTKDQKLLETLKALNPVSESGSQMDDQLESGVECAVMKIEKQEDEITLLKKEMAEEKFQSEVAEKQCLEANKKCSEFKTQNDFLNKELSNLKKDFENTLGQLKTVETQFQDLDSEHKSLQLRLDASESELLGVKQQVQLQQTENDQVVEKLKQDLIESGLRCQRFETELKDLSPQLQLLQKENNEQCIRIENYELKLASVQEQLSSLEAAISSKAKEIEELTENLKKAKCKMSEIQAKSDQALKDYESAKNKIFLLNRNARKREEQMLKMQADLEKLDTLEKSLKEELKSQEKVAKLNKEKIEELEEKLTSTESKYKEKDEALAKLWEQHGQMSAKVMEYESSKKLLQEQLQVVQSKPPEPYKRRLKHNSLLDTPEAPTLSNKADKKDPKTPPSPVLVSDKTKQGIITRVDTSVRMTRQRTRSIELQNQEPKVEDTPGDSHKKARLLNLARTTTFDKTESAKKVPSKPSATSSLFQRPVASSVTFNKEKTDSLLKRPLALSHESNLGASDVKSLYNRRTRRSSREGPSDCAQQ